MGDQSVDLSELKQTYIVSDITYDKKSATFEQLTLYPTYFTLYQEQGGGLGL